jgi:hypothetical protein
MLIIDNKHITRSNYEDYLTFRNSINGVLLPDIAGLTKQSIIYNALRFEDFKADLFPKVRNLIRSNKPDHPWLALNDVQMLEKAGLWQRDPQSGQEGYTLAAALGNMFKPT